MKLHICFFACAQLEVPKELITAKQLQELMLQQRPSFVPVSPDVNATKVYDKETGITQCRLSNGIPVNYKVYFGSDDIFLLSSSLSHRKNIK